MNAVQITAVILLVATVAGLWRTLRRSGRWLTWRCLGQVLVAAALWLLLYSPSMPQARWRDRAEPGVDSATELRRASGLLTLALPDVAIGDDRTIERVPDLATGLRRHRDRRAAHSWRRSRRA
ncbi:MAG: hypothetical protein R3F08_04180 [Dokdonella sp.]